MWLPCGVSTDGQNGPAFAGIGQQIFMATLRAFDSGETEMQVAAIQISIDHIHDIWPPVAVSAFVAVIPSHFQLLEIRFDTSLLLVVLDLFNGKYLAAR
jgi:hypothetical protein